jgi:hypothetical protein
MPDKIPFACAASAIRQSVSGSVYMGSYEAGLMASLVLATDGEAAETALRAIALARWPESQGWLGHQGAAEPITQEQLKVLSDGQEAGR